MGPSVLATEALRCRFTDLAGLYLHPGGSQHRVDSLWWWVKFVYDHSALCPTEGGSFKRVFSLGEGHKSNRAAWVKGKAYLFALAYKARLVVCVSCRVSLVVSCRVVCAHGLIKFCSTRRIGGRAPRHSLSRSNREKEGRRTPRPHRWW